jgi:two-component system LytT family sensor kinase
MPTSINPLAPALSPADDRPIPGQRRSWLGWPLYVLFALLFGIYLGLNEAIGLRSAASHFATWKPFVWELSSSTVIFALIPLIRWFENRVQIDSRPRLRIILIHLSVAVGFSLVHTTTMVLLRKLVYALAGDSYEFGNVLSGGFYELQKDLISYFVILLVLFAIREFRVRRAGELRAQALAAQLSEARLRHLTAQIEPHFLFNSLNAISNRMHEDIEAADRMISQLGDLLRAAYESDDSVLVPLARELGWLRGYAAMMAERFRGQLAFEIEVDPGIETCKVPRLLLQPIVENAIRHGLTDGAGWLRVDVRCDGKQLDYTVSDNGAGFPHEPLVRGTGISNVSRRLQLLFPGTHKLTFSSRAPRGAVVCVSFPIST